MSRAPFRLGWCVLVLVISVAGCTWERPIGISSEPDGDLRAHIPICHDEVLRSAQLRHPLDLRDRSRDRVLWTITADNGGRPIESLQVGSVPAGYRAEGEFNRADLERRLPEADLLLWVDLGGELHTMRFRSKDVPSNDDVLHQGPPQEVTSRDQLLRDQGDACSPDRIFFWLSLAVALMLVIGIAVATFRRRRRGVANMVASQR
jgi:hypothetical protein